MAPDAPARYELCAVCDEPTGRAGAGDDSLYAADVGPLCQGCYDDAFSARPTAPDAPDAPAVVLPEALSLALSKALAAREDRVIVGHRDDVERDIAAQTALRAEIAAAIADARREAEGKAEEDLSNAGLLIAHLRDEVANAHREGRAEGRAEALAEVDAACERLTDDDKNGTISLWAWADDIGWEVAPKDNDNRIIGHPTPTAAILAAAAALDAGEEATDAD